MRLAELSERSGVPVGTIKYYLREKLLPPGRRISATQAEYEEAHLRRLALVRALIQVGRVPVATAREVIAHIDDDSLSTTFRLGAAMWALPQPPDPDPEDASTRRATAVVESLVEELGWEHTREIGALSPSYRALVSSLATLARVGYDFPASNLTAYGRAMQQVADLDHDHLAMFEGDTEKAEVVVATALLFEPALLALRRLAQQEETTRRYGL
ncbi:MerR family transcriptional regulator [Streptomyces sp. SID5785]|uniref:MerR family transcriptional regulator n=1 Tax=Streptomyces sp. SID5785 TaxID=2690309 RepID=UPI00136149D2|nr:MerR family transcriptional regulator [Streptomyces sp. SID5785]MZD09452.1 MerR family transcriptional regulator [Streptomyces sp. SID5785]